MDTETDGSESRFDDVFEGEYHDLLGTASELGVYSFTVYVGKWSASYYLWRDGYYGNINMKNAS